MPNPRNGQIGLFINILDESKIPLKFFGHRADGNYFPLFRQKALPSRDALVIRGKLALEPLPVKIGRG
jgi:hypothetical protein